MCAYTSEKGTTDEFMTMRAKRMDTILSADNQSRL